MEEFNEFMIDKKDGDQDVKRASQQKARRKFFLHYLVLGVLLCAVVVVCLYVKKNS